MFNVFILLIELSIKCIVNIAYGKYKTNMIKSYPLFLFLHTYNDILINLAIWIERNTTK